MNYMSTAHRENTITLTETLFRQSPLPLISLFHALALSPLLSFTSLFCAFSICYCIWLYPSFFKNKYIWVYKGPFLNKTFALHDIYCYGCWPFTNISERQIERRSGLVHHCQKSYKWQQ